MKKPLKAVILAAGIGNRLLPHTNNLPKCLLKVRGAAIMEYQLAALKSCGIEEVVIVTGHCGQKIRDFVDAGVKVIENDRYLTTNSSYSLWLARDLIKDGFICMNSDLIFSGEMLKALLSDEAGDAIIVDGYSDVNDDMFKGEMKENRIVSMDKHMADRSDMVTVVGPAKFSREGAWHLMDIIGGFIQQEENMHWCYKAYNDFAQGRPFYGVKNPGMFWAEIDMPDDLERAKKNLPPDFLLAEEPALKEGA